MRARLEIAEIADRCHEEPGGGPALLFEHVLLEDGRRSSQPVAINLFGSMRRMCLALGVEKLDDDRRTDLRDAQSQGARGALGKLAMLPQAGRDRQVSARVKGGRPPCQELVRAGRRSESRRHSLSHHLARGRRPLHHPADGDHHRSRRGIRNVGMYRVQVLGRNTLAMHWQRHKVGAAHWREMAAGANGCRW